MRLAGGCVLFCQRRTAFCRLFFAGLPWACWIVLVLNLERDSSSSAAATLTLRTSGAPWFAPRWATYRYVPIFKALDALRSSRRLQYQHNSAPHHTKGGLNTTAVPGQKECCVALSTGQRMIELSYNTAVFSSNMWTSSGCPASCVSSLSNHCYI